MMGAFIAVLVVLGLGLAAELWTVRRRRYDARINNTLSPLQSVAEDARTIMPVLTIVVSCYVRECLNDLIVGEPGETLATVGSAIEEALLDEGPAVLETGNPRWPMAIADIAALVAVNTLRNLGSYGEQVLQDFKKELETKIPELELIRLLKEELR